MSKSAKKKYESPRQLERQANILKATREMLADVGYHATTMFLDNRPLMQELRPWFRELAAE